MADIRAEIPSDASARERLLDRAFGSKRYRKTSQRFRDGRLPAEGLAFTALSKSGRVIGTLRMWDVVAGSAGPALLLGPLAVDEGSRGQGLGADLMQHSLDAARARGHHSVILVGDLSYYERFGFTREVVAGLQMPGPLDRNRFLGLELTQDALTRANGMIIPSGKNAIPFTASPSSVARLRKIASVLPA